MDRKTDRIIDEETGEIIELVEVREGESIVSKEDKERKEYFALDKIERSHQPNFIFSVYNRCKPYLDYNMIDSADISRLIMLSTYVNYDSVLMLNHKTKMNIDDMQEIVRIKNSTNFNQFYSKLIKLKILRQKDDCIKMSKKFFFKGTTEGRKRTNNLTRLYIDEVRYIFNNMSIRSIKKLGYIFMLLPHIDYERNIVCHNSDRKDHEPIKPMTTGEFADLVGVNRSKVMRLIKDLISIETIDGTSFLGVFLTKGYQYGTIHINRKVLYAGKLLSEHLEEHDMLFINQRDIK